MELAKILHKKLLEYKESKRTVLIFDREKNFLGGGEIEEVQLILDEVLAYEGITQGGVADHQSPVYLPLSERKQKPVMFGNPVFLIKIRDQIKAFDHRIEDDSAIRMLDMFRGLIQNMTNGNKTEDGEEDIMKSMLQSLTRFGDELGRVERVNIFTIYPSDLVIVVPDQTDTTKFQ